MGEAVHGLYAVFHLIHLRKIHVVPVILEVARLLPHVELQDLGPIDELIAPLQVFLSFKIFKEIAKEGTVGMIDNKPRADFIGDAEKIQFFAEPPVVSLFSPLRGR